MSLARKYFSYINAKKKIEKAYKEKTQEETNVVIPKLFTKMKKVKWQVATVPVILWIKLSSLCKRTFCRQPNKKY